MTTTLPDVNESLVGSAPRVTVLSDRCAGCQECLVRCPTGALTMDLNSWTVVADNARCVGCRQCVRTCPFAAIDVVGAPVVAVRVELTQRRPETLAANVDETHLGFTNWSDALAEAERCLNCPDPTCVRGCPAHNDIPSFIAALREGDLDEAHRVLRRTSFLPDVCARVCDQALQCEGACTWSLAGAAPVAIGALERFVTDNAPVPPVEVVSVRGGPSVAVVGSGPAALGAAHELVSAGATVTVFERDDEPGGLLNWGIPNFTLPRPVAQRPWHQLIAAGVEVVGGHEVTAGELDELRSRFDAVILAHGAGGAMRVAVPGSDLGGVVDATTFLHEARSALARERACPLLSSRATKAPPFVLVLGAGNTAMDVARLARRLGADVSCVDWMDRRWAPVRPDELDEAVAEGVEVQFTRTLTRLEGESGWVARAFLATTTQPSALRSPQIVPDATIEVAVDLVVMAMGYRIEPTFPGVAPVVPVARPLPAYLDRRFVASGLAAAGTPEHARGRPIAQLSLTRDVGQRIAERGTLAGVYVVGDALVGPSSVVEAMAQGRSVARAILRHGTS